MCYCLQRSILLGGPLKSAIENVLMAYAAYRPDVGYVQVPKTIACSICCIYFDLIILYIKSLTLGNELYSSDAFASDR